MIAQAFPIQDATPNDLDSIEELIAEIDLAFSNLQSLDKMGDYVKFDVVSDMILDIRGKATQLR